MSQSSDVSSDLGAKAEEAKELIRQEVAKIRQELAAIKQELAKVADQSSAVVMEKAVLPEEEGSTSPPQATTKPSADGVKVTAGDLAAAKAVLEEIGASSNIVVVPNTVMLGKDNNAVTIKDPGKIAFYRDEVLDDSLYDEGVNFPALKKSIDLNTILVSLSVLNSPDLLKCGTIWHEQGHVAHGATENGSVFAHELRCLRTQRSAQDAKAFVKDHREAGAYYTKTAVDPGLAELEQELKTLGLTFTAGEKAAAQAQATALNVGKKLSGYPEKLKQLAGAEQQPDLSMVPLNGEFPWAGYTWKLTFLEMRYKVTVSKKRETSRAEGKSIEGTPAQIKKTAGAFKDPPDLTSMSVGDEFSWEGASWVLATAQQYSEIVVVKRDQ